MLRDQHLGPHYAFSNTSFLWVIKKKNFVHHPQTIAQ